MTQNDLDTIIGKLVKEIATLEHLQHIRVTIPIERDIEFLKDILADVDEEQRGRKFDIVQTVDEHATVAYAVGTTSISAGSNVLTFGDMLTVTVTAADGYTLKKFTINGADKESPVTFKVTTDIAVVVETEAVPEEE